MSMAHNERPQNVLIYLKGYGLVAHRYKIDLELTAGDCNNQRSALVRK